MRAFAASWHLFQGLSVFRIILFVAFEIRASFFAIGHVCSCRCMDACQQCEAIEHGVHIGALMKCSRLYNAKSCPRSSRWSPL